jgi:hypothetical protein
MEQELHDSDRVTESEQNSREYKTNRESKNGKQ